MRLTAQEIFEGDFSGARGKVILREFDPHAGHEQAGNLPALVISPATAARPRCQAWKTCPSALPRRRRKGPRHALLIASQTHQFPQGKAAEVLAQLTEERSRDIEHVRCVE